jgi:hypothetical protein
VAAFNCAIIAHDIPHSFGPDWPRGFNVGIIEGAGIGSQGWRKVLSGKLSDPLASNSSTVRQPTLTLALCGYQCGSPMAQWPTCPPDLEAGDNAS